LKNRRLYYPGERGKSDGTESTNGKSDEAPIEPLAAAHETDP
jgi:hypothetical protein